MAPLLIPSSALARSQPPEDRDIRQKTQNVLARPEFSSGDKAQMWLLEQLSSALKWLGSLRQSNLSLFLLILAGCILILTLLMVHIIWSLYRTLSLSRRRQPGEGSHEHRGRLSLSYRDEALRKATQGEFTEAIRYLFLSLVYRFDESGRVSFQKAYTNREYLALFGDRAEIHSELKVFVDTLDENWYGQHPTDQQKYESCLGLYQSLQ